MRMKLFMLLCLFCCAQAYSDPGKEDNFSLLVSNQMESVHIRYLRFYQKWGSFDVDEDSEAWKNDDVSAIAPALFNSLENGDARLELDTSIIIDKMDKEYVLQSTESYIYYTTETNGVYHLVQWDEPVGKKLILCPKYIQINGKVRLSANIYMKETIMVDRKEFSPFPSLSCGEPVLETSVSFYASFFLDSDGYQPIAAFGGNDDFVIDFCEICPQEKKRVSP